MPNIHIHPLAGISYPTSTRSQSQLRRQVPSDYRNPGLLGGVLSFTGLLLFTGEDPEHVKPDHT